MDKIIILVLCIIGGFIVVAGVAIAIVVPLVLKKTKCSDGYVSTGGTCVECGLTSNVVNVKIIGGKEAAANSWPFVVYVQPYTGSTTYRCGGTLISKRTVLTAAHCIDEVASARVFLGMHRRFDVSSSSVKKMIIHPNYDKTAITNDIALLILSESANLTDNIKLACLPSQSNSYPDYTSNAWAVGWGVINKATETLPEVLYNVKLPVVASSNCPGDSPIIDASQICAGSTGIDTCQGDSGGPLFVTQTISNESRYVVSGIVSYGVGCGTNPGVYTRVSHFINWIQANWET